MIFPEIDPVIFSIGPLKIRWYGLMYVIGFLFAWWLARRRCTWSSARGATKSGCPCAMPTRCRSTTALAPTATAFHNRSVLFVQIGRFDQALREVAALRTVSQGAAAGLLGAADGVDVATKAGLVHDEGHDHRDRDQRADEEPEVEAAREASGERPRLGDLRRRIDPRRRAVRRLLRQHLPRIGAGPGGPGRARCNGRRAGRRPLILST